MSYSKERSVEEVPLDCWPPVGLILCPISLISLVSQCEQETHVCTTHPEPSEYQCSGDQTSEGEAKEGSEEVVGLLVDTSKAVSEDGSGAREVAEQAIVVCIR